MSVLTNDQNKFRGITYQEAYMSRVSATYSEMVLMDATYKLVYILCAVDGNGMTESPGIQKIWTCTALTTYPDGTRT